ncbi:MAG: hypothetical protein HYY06_07045 [Deltaproteobacteria bacterium]|nr:hypothetical protein [Deltaproteobacteria bacterium]
MTGKTDPEDDATQRSEKADRGEPSESTSPRKEKVLHTRIPAALDQALKGFARSMRVPVSNLVRVLLEDAVEVAHRATDKVAEAAERATERVAGTPGASDEKKTEPLAGVFGYQPLTLGVEASCARCGRALDVGEEAFLGLRDAPGPRVFVCPTCLPKPKRKESTP